MIARSGEEALQLMGADQYDAIVLDLILPGATGFDLLEKFSRQGMTTPLVVCSAYITSATSAFLKNFASVEIVKKPFRPEEPTAAVERALGSKGQNPDSA